MYVCIIKNHNKYSLKYNTVFIDRYNLLKELSQDPGDYLIFELNTSNDLFTDALFLTFYKSIYMQLHAKHPIVYPVKYIRDHFSCCALPRKEKWIVKKFLHNIKNDHTYANHNCVVYLNKNRIDYNLSNINEIASSPPQSDMLFICLHFRKQKLIPWSVYTTFKEALENTITIIIKSHDFYILNNELNFKNFYYIYGFNIKDNQLCKSCILDEDWCNILTNLKQLAATKKFEANDINYFKCCKNKIELCGKHLCTIYNELRDICVQIDDDIAKRS